MKTNETKASRLSHLKAQIQNTRNLMFNAAEMKDAAGFGRLNREFEALCWEANRLERS